MYSSNFDDESFRKANIREFNKTIDDPCAIAQRDNDNNKKLKFLTTNHRDLLEGRETMNYFGMTVRDKLFVPAEQMDTFSKLRQGETGNIMTNCNASNELGPLPIATLPARYQLYHGDVDIEDGMRNLQEVNKNSCNPRDAEYHERHFYIFGENTGVEAPNALNSVENGVRGGVSTRFDFKARPRQ